jgi:hypothetical protein
MNLLPDIPQKLNLRYVGSKFLLGRVELTLSMNREEDGELKIDADQKLNILWHNIYHTNFTSRVMLDDFKPTKSIYREVKKNKMRFEFFYKGYLWYIRIAQFQGLIDIDPDGKIISPKGLKLEEYDSVRKLHTFTERDTIIFDPSLLIIILSRCTTDMIDYLNTKSLIFISLDKVVTFKLNIVSESKRSRHLRIIYMGAEAKKMKYTLNELVIDKARGVATKLIGHQKIIGKVSMYLAK